MASGVEWGVLTNGREWRLYSGRARTRIAKAHLLGILQSRPSWFVISQICQPLRLRAGLWQYRILPQFISRLPIPATTAADRETLGALAMSITENSRARYALHERVRHRISTDLATDGKTLNRKLTEWWNLDFRGLHEGIKKTLKGDIPLKERDEWEIWFNDQLAEHQRLTAEIIRQETELNENVYRLFELTSAEIEIIESSTKYQYGEV